MNSFSPEQREVIDTWGLGMAVLAGAGSGKTTTLVAKCCRLVELKPEAKFAAVSFTERSASDLRSKLSQSLLRNSGSGSFSQHWVMTIHGLCGAVIREYPREAGFEGEEVILAEHEGNRIWEQAIESLWLDDLPDEVLVQLDVLLNRENRNGIAYLLKRIKDLYSFGVLDFLKNSSDPSTRALATVADFTLARYERIKKRQGVLDFNDLERGANQALQLESVRQVYHRRFEMVLVDEFQDTNPIQAGIILKLARPDLSNLCVVGDPKQSIYRFRDADVSVFEEFCSRLPVSRSLTWNFRSRAGIIHFTNQICEKTFQASEMKFEPLDPKREQPADQESVIRLDVKDPSDLARWILKQSEQGTALHEMAVLVRKVRGNEKWLRALTAAGIPIALGSGGFFWEEPRVRELVAFLKWWDNPGNSLSGGVFLRAPWMEISDSELDYWVKQDPTWQGPFFSSSHPIAEALRPFLSQKARPGELLLALLADQKREDELGSPLLSLWHKVEDLSSQGLDFHTIVSELQQAVQESRREREVPAPRNLGQLTVLTLHGAKGLEFPYVILIDFGAKRRVADMPLLFWDRIHGAFLGARDESGDRDRKNPSEVKWRDIEKSKNLAESKRLFYVALTRARESLFLVCPELPESQKDSQADLKSPFLDDDWRGWLESSGIQLPRNQDLNRVSSKSSLRTLPENQPRVSSLKSFKPRVSRSRHSVTEWTLLAKCPRAYEWTYIRPKTITPEVPEISLIEKEETTTQAQISQQELGSQVHACLEKGDFEGLKNLENLVGPSRFLAEPVMSWALSSEWMAPTQPENQREVWTELSFEVPYQGEILVGSIDRLIATEKARYSIIDFKISEKPKSVGALLNAYQTQLDLYAWSLCRLDPGVKPEQIEAFLINISSRTIQTVSVPLGRTAVEELANHSFEIINGQLGAPNPGAQCRFCKFKPACPEATE